MNLTIKEKYLCWFMIGFLLSTFLHSYVIVEHFVSKRYLKNRTFYLDGALYKLEKVR
jgi:hypothetical protein